MKRTLFVVSIHKKWRPTNGRSLLFFTNPKDALNAFEIIRNTMKLDIIYSSNDDFHIKAKSFKTYLYLYSISFASVEDMFNFLKIQKHDLL